MENTVEQCARIRGLDATAYAVSPRVRSGWNTAIQRRTARHLQVNEE